MGAVARSGAWIAALLVACSNPGGEVLGASGVSQQAIRSCQIPCTTLDDCKKFPPLRSRIDAKNYVELPYTWVACTDGICIDAECDANVPCSVQYDPNRSSSTCTNNTCNPSCGSCADQRDKCIDGLCIRQPFTGECAEDEKCQSDSDCKLWERCRASRGCCELPFQVEKGSASVGAGCDDDETCGAKFFAQDLIHAGLTGDLLINSSCDACEPPTGSGFDIKDCNTGFTCVTTDKKYSTTHLLRRVCLPNACAVTCTSSARECNADGECNGGEKCMVPISGCAGVCVNVGCAACGDWVRSHRTRTCVDKGAAVPIEVRRPD